MIDPSPTHRAPQGIVLGVAIMMVFYIGVWMGVRLLYPAPVLHCRSVVAHPLMPGAPCPKGTAISGACACPQR